MYPPLAYQDLKDALCKEGLALQHFDHNHKRVVHTNWSSYGLGAVLGQIDYQGREVISCLYI